MDVGIREAEAAQQTVIRTVIGGSVLLLRASGPAVDFIKAAANGMLGTSGIMNLKAMLQSGKELKVLPINGSENYRKFSDASKEYGVKYAVITKRDEDKAIDMYEVIYAVDASKVARIFERYGINTPVKSNGSVRMVESDMEKTIKDLTKNRDMVSKMMSPVNGEYVDITNPLLAPEGENQSGAVSGRMDDIKNELERIERSRGIKPSKRASVRKEMNLIEQLSKEGVMDDEKRISNMLTPSDATNEDKIKDVKEVAQLG